MDRDSKVVAEVDLSRVSVMEVDKVEIDFFNEIDVWAKMEFRSRDQSLGRKGSKHQLNSSHYSFRDRFD